MDLAEDAGGKGRAARFATSLPVPSVRLVGCGDPLPKVIGLGNTERIEDAERLSPSAQRFGRMTHLVFGVPESGERPGLLLRLGWLIGRTRGPRVGRGCLP